MAIRILLRLPKNLDTRFRIKKSTVLGIFGANAHFDDSVTGFDEQD